MPIPARGWDMRDCTAPARSSPTPNSGDPGFSDSGILSCGPFKDPPPQGRATPAHAAPAPPGTAAMLSCQVRWNPFPRAPTLHPRALRGLASVRKVPGTAPFPQPPTGRTARPAPRLRVRRLRRGDFRPGAALREAVRLQSEALLPLVLKRQVPPVVQP